jgi:hypothetical protein
LIDFHQNATSLTIGPARRRGTMVYVRQLQARRSGVPVRGAEVGSSASIDRMKRKRRAVRECLSETIQAERVDSKMQCAQQRKVMPCSPTEQSR